MSASQQSTFKAATWMAGSIASFIAMSVAGRETTKVLDVVQVMELRALIGLLVLLPIVFASGGLSAMRTRHPLLHIARNVTHYTGQLAWLYALTLIPLAELISIEFTTPLWTAVLAVAFLGEKLTRPRVTAIVLGLIGVLIILRPGGGTIGMGHLLVLFAAATYGVSMTMVKFLTRDDSVLKIIFWMMVIQLILGIVPSALVWQAPPPGLWPWILLIGITGMTSHFCLARALTYADATVVSPMDFLRLPLTALVGWVLYSERLDAMTVIGAVLILAGNLVNLRRRQPTPDEAATTGP